MTFRHIIKICFTTAATILPSCSRKEAEKKSLFFPEKISFHINMHRILFFSSLCVMFCQTAEVNTLKPWGLSPVNWSKRGQIRRAQCPPGTGGGKADLRCPIQGSGQVILVPWQCDNLKLYRQKFASECSRPHRKIYPPSDFCHGLSGRWCSSSELPIVSVGAPTGVLGHAHMRWLFMHMGFLCLGRSAGVGLGTCRGFPSVLLGE